MTVITDPVYPDLTIIIHTNQRNYLSQSYHTEVEKCGTFEPFLSFPSVFSFSNQKGQVSNIQNSLLTVFPEEMELTPCVSVCQCMSVLVCTCGRLCLCEINVLPKSVGPHTIQVKFSSMKCICF